jgi:hypothetical protein
MSLPPESWQSAIPDNTPGFNERKPDYIGGPRRRTRLMSILTASSRSAVHENIRDGLIDCGVAPYAAATSRNMHRGIISGYTPKPPDDLDLSARPGTPSDARAQTIANSDLRAGYASGPWPLARAAFAQLLARSNLRVFEREIPLTRFNPP